MKQSNNLFKDVINIDKSKKIELPYSAHKDYIDFITKGQESINKIINEEFPDIDPENDHLSEYEKNRYKSIKKNYKKRLMQFLNSVVIKVQDYTTYLTKDQENKIN